MIRLFLDANVLFTAAHNPSGKAALIIDLGVQGNWEIVSSSYAIEEARRNISIKFPDCLERFETLISAILKVPTGSGLSCPVSLPEKDRPILEAATHCKATHLLTGDMKPPTRHASARDGASRKGNFVHIVPLNPAYEAGLAGHVPAKDFGPFMNHPGLTGGVVIQTVSEFLDSFMKPEIKKGGRRRK